MWTDVSNIGGVLVQALELRLRAERMALRRTVQGAAAQAAALGAVATPFEEMQRELFPLERRDPSPRKADVPAPPAGLQHLHVKTTGSAF